MRTKEESQREADMMRRRFGRQVQPPFDGGPACIACAIEVRSLYATAFNLVDHLRRGATSAKIDDLLSQLSDTVEFMRPLVEAHFARDEHCYGNNDIDPLAPALPNPDPRTRH